MKILIILISISFISLAFVTYKIGYIDKNGRFLILGSFDECFRFKESIALIKKNGMYGFIDKNGSYIVQPIFDFADSFSNGLARVGNGKTFKFEFVGKIGFINKMGKFVINPIETNSNNIKNFSENFAAIKIDQKWGFINKKGKISIPAKFDDVENFSENLAAVKIDNKWGFINKKGDLVIPAKFLWVHSFSNKLALVSIENNTSIKCGYIDSSGKYAIKPQYRLAYNFSEDLATTTKGIINKSNEVIFSITPYHTFAFKEGIAKVQIDTDTRLNKRNYKYNYVNKSGKLILSELVDKAHSFSECLGAVKINGKWGYIDKTGKFIIEPQYYNAQSFSESLAAVTIKITLFKYLKNYIIKMFSKK